MNIMTTSLNDTTNEITQPGTIKHVGSDEDEGKVSCYCGAVELAFVSFYSQSGPLMLSDRMVDISPGLGHLDAP